MVTYFIFGLFVKAIFGSNDYNLIIVYGIYLIILLSGTILAINKKDWVRSIGNLIITIFIILLIDFFVMTILLYGI
jgi:hypothetical protein